MPGSEFLAAESLNLSPRPRAAVFRENKIRFVLIALGMMVGTACVILVVTIGMTGKQYAVRQIESIAPKHDRRRISERRRGHQP